MLDETPAFPVMFTGENLPAVEGGINREKGVQQTDKRLQLQTCILSIGRYKVSGKRKMVDEYWKWYLKSFECIMGTY